MIIMMISFLYVFYIFTHDTVQRFPGFYDFILIEQYLPDADL